jgi:membrane fusion protein, heavy metal efflux system
MNRRQRHSETSIGRSTAPARRGAAPTRWAGPRPRRQGSWDVVLVGLVFAVVSSAPATAVDLIPVDPAQQNAFGIELAAPQAAGETLTRRYPAKVTVPNPQMRVVSAPQSGVLSALLVAEGEHVSAGQVLAEIKSPELVDTQSQYLESVTRLNLAESELKRDQMLYKEGVIAERRLLETQAKQRELATQVEQRRQLLALAGLPAEASTPSPVPARSPAPCRCMPPSPGWCWSRW